MKERPLDFDFNDDDTLVEFDDTQRAKLEKGAKELQQTAGMLMYLVKSGKLGVGTRDSIASILDHQVQDVCNVLDYDTYLKKSQAKTLREIQEVNVENRILRQQLGEKVSLEDCRERLKLVNDGFLQWAKTEGFGWISDRGTDDWGTLKGTMRTELGRRRRSDDAARQKMIEFGFEFDDPNEDGAKPIANEKNIELLKKLVHSLSPDAIPYEIKINARGSVPRIESVDIMLHTWDCLEPYIKQHQEEERKEMEARMVKKMED